MLSEVWFCWVCGIGIRGDRKSFGEILGSQKRAVSHLVACAERSREEAKVILRAFGPWPQGIWSLHLLSFFILVHVMSSDVAGSWCNPAIFKVNVEELAIVKDLHKLLPKDRCRTLDKCLLLCMTSTHFWLSYNEVVNSDFLPLPQIHALLLPVSFTCYLLEGESWACVPGPVCLIIGYLPFLASLLVKAFPRWGAFS